MQACMHACQCTAASGQTDAACAADKGTYQRVGEATEVALRTLAEKVGVPSRVAQTIGKLARAARATHCNDYWQRELPRVGSPAASYYLVSCFTLAAAVAFLCMA